MKRLLSLFVLMTLGLGAIGKLEAVEPIFAVVAQGKQGEVEKLLKQVNPNVRDEDGNTPLHTLADGPLLKPGRRHGGFIMAKRLINNKADKTTTNKAGLTPYDLAVKNKRWSLYSLLKTNKAK